MTHTHHFLLTTALVTSIFANAAQPVIAEIDGASKPVANTALGTDRIIIRMRDRSRAPDADDLGRGAKTNLRVSHETADGAFVMKLPKRGDKDSLKRITDQLASRSDVEFVEPDEIMFPVFTPNDTQYSSQWHYFSPSSGSYGANLPGAWDITTGVSNVVVAIVDTGITNHADLAGRTLPGYDLISDASIANDGGGMDSDPSDPGDWVTSAESAAGFFVGCPVGNSSWHGTHVAGTIGAASNNGAGVTGINWQSKILPVRVLGKCGGYTSDIANGIRWAAGLAVTGAPINPNPARVINMSLGGSGTCSSTYQNAINAATSAGAIVVVAAGNANADALLTQPANCANVISVGSTGPTGNRAYYSNFGASVKISAPGGDQAYGTSAGVLSTLNSGTTAPVGDTYGYYQGTSMAAPHVVGVVSLMLSVKPELTFANVLQLLQSTVTLFPAGSACTSSICGAGILNAAAAVAAAKNYVVVTPAPAAFAKTSPNNGATKQPTTVSLKWQASTGAVSYEYCVDTINDNVCNGSWVNVGNKLSASTSAARGKTYYWHVRAINSTGTTNSNANAWWKFTT